jgi:hypothetical protein
MMSCQSLSGSGFTVSLTIPASLSSTSRVATMPATPSALPRCSVLASTRSAIKITGTFLFTEFVRIERTSSKPVTTGRSVPQIIKSKDSILEVRSPSKPESVCMTTGELSCSADLIWSATSFCLWTTSIFITVKPVLFIEKCISVFRSFYESSIKITTEFLDSSAGKPELLPLDRENRMNRRDNALLGNGSAY